MNNCVPNKNDNDNETGYMKQHGNIKAEQTTGIDYFLRLSASQMQRGATSSSRARMELYEGRDRLVEKSWKNTQKTFSEHCIALGQRFMSELVIRTDCKSRIHK